MKEPTVIANEAQHEAALQALASLWDADDNTPEGRRAAVWTVLIQDYERNHHPVEAPDPASAIRFRMEQQGLEPRDLVSFIGPLGTVSEVLAGTRPLTMTMIRALHDGLGIPPGSLLDGRSRMINT